MTYQTLDIAIEDGVGVITLNRPQKKNAMNPALHRDMVAALEEMRYDTAARVVVITGAGDSFCAGMDLKEFFTDLKDDQAAFDYTLRIATEWRGRTLRYFPKPTIAMVNGYCFGGAFSIVEGCDLAIAAEEATFGLSEINFKHFPGGSVSASLARLLRPRDALWYALLGRKFDGRKAAEIGFVNEAVPLDRLREETMAVARELAEKDPWALKATKDGYRHSLEMTWEASIGYTTALTDSLTVRQNDAWRSEGIGDFLTGQYKPGLGHKPGAEPQKP